jgi:hypothetical protein
VYVPPLDAVIKGDDATGQGSYLCRMTVAEFVDITAAPTTNPRIDLIVAELVDSQYRTITAANPLGNRLRVVKGDPAATPVVPTLPPTAIPIAQVLVPVNASSIVNANITDLRTSVGLPGSRVDIQTFPTSGTWTKPTGARAVLVDVISAGGGGESQYVSGATPYAGGGGGGRAQRTLPAAGLPSTVSVTVGTGGLGSIWANASSQTQVPSDGGASAFGSLLTCSGGKKGVGQTPGLGGGVGGIVETLTTTAPWHNAAVGGAGAGWRGAGYGARSAEWGGGSGGEGSAGNPGTLGGGNSVHGAGGGGSGGSGPAGAHGGLASTLGSGPTYTGAPVDSTTGCGSGGPQGFITGNVVYPGQRGGIPGGGGGGGYGIVSGLGPARGGDGARGEVRVITICT